MITSIITLAEEITRYLQLGEYRVKVDVERRWLPLIDVADVGKRCIVQVVPDNYELPEILTRSRKTEITAVLSVFLSRQVDFKKIAEIDETVLVYDEVYRLLTRAEQIENFVLIDARPDPLVDHMRMADSRLFLGRMQVTYRGLAVDGC